MNIKDMDRLVAGQNYPDVYIYNRENIRLVGQKLKNLSATEVETMLVHEGDIKGWTFQGICMRSLFI
ncbi:hypothetical protein [Lactococcus petauri]|uniref:hypothetical protein n=1 Tax=Lactococcus petauri TaxID=1940789 RepID=UPI00177AD4A2|nr:hypothetical protein [Lactococcus petauri]